MRNGRGTMPNRRSGLLLALGIAIAWPRPAVATTFTWTGAAGDAQFTTAGNWNPPGTPGPADVADFTGSTAVHVLVTPIAPATTVEVGELLVRRPVRFSGAPFEVWGVVDAATGDNLVLVAQNANVTLQNDLLLRAAGVVRTVSSLGPFTLDLCGAVGDQGAALPLTLRPLSATTIRLDRAGSYGGGTFVGSAASADAVGTVLIAHPSALGAGPVSLVNGGNLTFAAPTFANAIDAGAGVVNLRVAATASGAPDVNADGTCALALTGGQETSLTGAIAGAAGRINLQPLTTTGVATLELAGASSFAKPISVLAGMTLRVADPDALGATSQDTTLLTGATLELAAGIVTAPEPLNLSAPGANVATWRALGGDTVWSGAVTGSANLMVDVVAGRLAVLGSTSGFGLTKLGAGTLELDGPSQLGSLADVSAGTLRVNGSLNRSGVTVAVGARLEGTGTVIVSPTGAGLQIDGTLAPGDGGPGTLGVQGNVTFGAGSTFEVAIAGAAADRLAVTGAGGAALAGASLVIDAASAQPDTSFIILSGANVTGTFAGLPEGAIVGDFSISYLGGDGNDVALAPAPGSCSSDGEPPLLGPCPADQSLECDGPDGAAASFPDPTATDDCDPAPAVACTPASGMVFSLGTTAVECVAQDQTGNGSAPCGFEVTVADTTAPAIACPPPTTVTVNAGDPVIFAEATATDLCGAATVVCVPPSGTPLPPGATYSVTCTAGDAGMLASSCGFDLTVLSANQPPIADAGPDQFVSYTVIPPPVTLVGSASSDDGLPDPPGAISCAWSQVSGPIVALANPAACDTSFAVPPLAADEIAVLTFELTVSDGEAPSHDEVNVTVTSTNHAPQCPAIAPITVAEGASAVLDGSASFDPDGDPIAYLWEQTSGIPVLLAGDDAPVASFDAPAVGGSEILTFDLTVDDGLLAATCTYAVVVESENHCPTADAGDGDTASAGELVLLDGTGSDDPDGDLLVFSWTQTDGPPVMLLGAATATPSFVAPAVGAAGADLAFSLTVDDGFGCTSTATVGVHVSGTGTPPQCEHAHPSAHMLWPPDHRMVPIWVRGVHAGCSRTSVRIDRVTQDEPVDGAGDGHTTPDAKIRDDKVLLRAERGFGNGRVYHVHFIATDPSGSCSGTVEVCVPHSRGAASWLRFWKRGNCVDDGELYDSTRSP